jgi:hypothetical protein
MKLSITTSIILIATAVFPVEVISGDIFAKFYNNPTEQPPQNPVYSNPTEQPSQNPYEVDANGCVDYPQGKTDSDCQNASNDELFYGDRYSHSYKCTEGGGYACCASTNEYQSNVQDLGQCTRNYQVDASGCIPYVGGNNSDESCYNFNGFNGFDYSYKCTEGEQYVCCNSNVENLSNVQDEGQCQRNTTPQPTQQPTDNSRKNLRRRAYNK